MQSYFPQFKIFGESLSNDVTHLKNALVGLSKEQTEFYCGEGGTTFRFLVPRLTRKPGTYLVKGVKRLFERPQQELYKVIKSLGAVVDPAMDSLFIKSSGWPQQEINLEIDMSQSSQFASSLLLNSLNFDFPVNIHLTGTRVSQSYLDLTISLLKQLGCAVEFENDIIKIPKNSKPKKNEISIEADASSVFTLCAFAALKGELQIKNCFESSLQPDQAGLDILKKMQASISWEHNHLNFRGTENLKAIEISLSSNPDLFPVLAVLATRADGISNLTDLNNLDLKESPRKKNICDLLLKCGLNIECSESSVKIYGNPKMDFSELSFDFDPDHDHRMAMAAALINFWGGNLNILNRNCVNKSFPEFWEIVGL